MDMAAVPYIAHYTTEQGLEGILRSKTLWATQYDFLNDRDEAETGMRYVDSIYEESNKYLGLTEE